MTSKEVKNSSMNPATIRSWILVFWGLIITTAPSFGQNQLFTSLKQDDKLEAELYLYPSTLRMINIANNQGFDEMVKDIEKIVFYKLPGRDNREIRELAARFIEEEDFEELMTLSSKEETVYLLGDDSDEIVALVRTDGDFLALNLQGMIGIHKIPELINSLNSDNFLNVFEIGRSERKEHQQDTRDN